MKNIIKFDDIKINELKLGEKSEEIINNDNYNRKYKNYLNRKSNEKYAKIYDKICATLYGLVFAYLYNRYIRH